MVPIMHPSPGVLYDDSQKIADIPAFLGPESGV
ncbi:protein of unknown function [Trichlorobacter ammonificans]|uniref:Uncharacterized protein n=1 Tax=Trichlorobacter ammonificans TaxID=2916410 RepID=A0ABM9D6M4_9BACT|nr:protein of unknown function [Trichlorobacter ammonificans]